MVAEIEDKLAILYCRKADKVKSDLLQKHYGVVDCLMNNYPEVDLNLKIDVLEHYNKFNHMSDEPCLKKILNV